MDKKVIMINKMGGIIIAIAWIIIAEMLMIRYTGINPITIIGFFIALFNATENIKLLICMIKFAKITK